METIRNGRWLVGSSGRSTSQYWRGIELVTPEKQCLFMERLLFSFVIRRKQVRHISTARLGPEAWEQLLETSCLLQQILADMLLSELFTSADLAKARRRGIEGRLF